MNRYRPQSPGAAPLYRATPEEGGPNVLIWEGADGDAPQARRDARLSLFTDEPIALITRPLALEAEGGQARLVMEDPGGEPLANLIGRDGLRIDQALDLAVNIAEAVQIMHGRRLAHGRLSPRAIFADSARRSLRLALSPDGFVRAADRPVTADEWAAADLAYCAPEQSGRTAAAPDLRADLYALGAIFHEMLTGAPPFRSIDPLEMLHMHLAVAPPRITREDCPPVVADIVAKLLEKAPADRYQTAYGLLTDLRHCRAAYVAARRIDTFPLAARDAQATFRIPDKLYGREAELERLDGVARRALSGGVELVMVRGRSGFGKSAFVDRLRGRLDSDPLFIAGKYEEVQTLPYLAIIQALRDFVLRKVAEGGQVLDEFRDLLVQKLGENIAVMAEFLPELRRIVPNPPSLRAEDPLERNQRFRIAIQALFELISSPENPVILFLDDLQWADAPSIALIEDVVSSAALSHLLIVGAYRDNEVGPTHSVARLEAALRETTPISFVEIRPLRAEDAEAMICDALHMRPDADVARLARLVHGKTQGNAFHLRRLLSALHQDGAVRFDLGAERWRFDVDAVAAEVVDVDVAHLMTERLDRLSAEAREAMRLAACFGTVFADASLGVVSDLKDTALARGLAEAVADGVVERVEDGLCRFSHDMVRDAAYRLTDEAERSRLHHQIGSWLIHEIEDLVTDDRLFPALDQIALGLDHLKDGETARVVVQGALAASRRAKAVAAHDIALRYMRMVEGLDPVFADADWDHAPDTAHAVALELMELVFVIDGFEAAEPYFKLLLERLSEPRARAQVYKTMVTLFTSRSDYVNAIEYGVQGLKLLDINLEGAPGPKIMGQLAMIQVELRKHDIYDLSSLPPIENRFAEEQIEMLMIVATPAILYNKDLFVLISMRMFRITLRHGVTSPGLFSAQCYAAAIFIGFGAGGMACKIGENLWPLLEKHDATPHVRGRFLYTFALVTGWHGRSYADLLELLNDGIKYAWAAADLEYVGYFYYGMLKYPWLMSRPLDELGSLVKEFDRYRRRLNHEVLDSLSQLYLRAIARLSDPSETGAYCEADRQVKAAMGGEVSLGNFAVTQLMVTHIFQDWENLDELFHALLAEEEFALLGPEFVDYYLLLGLSLTRPKAGIVAFPTAQRRRRLRKCLKVLKKLARRHPENHDFQHGFLMAEMARLRGHAADAQAKYREAASRAEAKGRWAYLGMIADCAASAADAQGDVAVANDWLLRAHAAYQRWGATNKTSAMAEARPDLFAAAVSAPTAAAPTLDLSTLIKASQAILEITDLDTLLKRLMQIAMENAGADKGALFLAEEGGLRLAAEARLDGAATEVTVTADGAIDDLDPARHPREFASQVGASMEAVILNDAARASRFEAFRYVQAQAPKSLMCLPVASSGSLKAVLHLENSLAAGVFTEDRRQLLTTLVSLAAISLANAMLYARQEEALRIEKRASEELTRINRLKDEFLANTSHELRTPLNGIIGLADSMADGAAGDLPEEAQDTLRLIVSSGKRLSGLVNEILDFSRLRDGELEVEMRPTDARALTDVVFALMRVKARGAGVTLENGIEAEAPNVLADEDRLQQILLNLVDNGVKFAGGGVVRVEMAEEDGRALISVVDDGTGVPEEARERIFQSFEQADASIQRVFGGIGLGLAIARSLVELQGGSIRLDSRPGEGARFTFDLEATAAAAAPQGAPVARLQAQEPEIFAPEPIVPAPQPARVAAAPATGPDRRRRTLIVDDDPVNLRVLENYMGLEGFEVHLAQNGEEALSVIESGWEPDVVILDIMMPRMSGYEVCRRIRDSRPAARLPVVMLTAKNQVEDLRIGFDAGATDYLTKPFSREELSARMRAHMELARVSSAYERFVPVEFLEFLGRDSILDIDLGDNAARRMSIMFTDIRGYTSIAESLSPADSFRFLNTYFEHMGPVVQENNGIVNQYLGDGMMSLFPGQPADAVSAAVGIQKELRRFNADRAARGALPVGTGIGVHTGDLVMGILGDKYRRSGNVVADTVNLTARLEGLTKHYGASIAVSEAVIEALPEPDLFPHRRLDMVRVVGKTRPVTVYEVFAGDDEDVIRLKSETRSAFEAARDAFRDAAFADARVAWENVLKINPKDAAARRLAARAGELERAGAPEGWDGTDELRRK